MAAGIPPISDWGDEYFVGLDRQAEDAYAPHEGLMLLFCTAEQLRAWVGFLRDRLDPLIQRCREAAAPAPPTRHRHGPGDMALRMVGFVLEHMLQAREDEDVRPEEELPPVLATPGERVVAPLARADEGLGLLVAELLGDDDQRTPRLAEEIEDLGTGRALFRIGRR